MQLFDSEEFNNHQQVTFCHDPDSGLKAIIAIHDTRLGPSLGGCRMWDYADEEEALRDVLRLSEGMTYKNAVAGLNLGGGKAVIMANSKTEKTDEMMRSFGRFVDGLGGRYLTAEDVGISQADADIIATQTQYVSGTSLKGLGDPSPYTAWGVFQGIKAALNAKFGTDSLKGKHVAVQGIGSVGYGVAEHLHEAGANLTVADVYQPSLDKAKAELGAAIAVPDCIHAIDCDILSPCALGATLNSKTIPEIKAEIIAGAANNQLAEEGDGKLLFDRNILYAPDYVINAGGVISIGDTERYPTKSEMLNRIEQLYDVLTDIFKRSQDENAPPEHIARVKAEERLKSVT